MINCISYLCLRFLQFVLANQRKDMFIEYMSPKSLSLTAVRQPPLHFSTQMSQTFEPFTINLTIGFFQLLTQQARKRRTLSAR